MKKIFFQTGPGDNYLVAGIKPGYEAKKVIKFSERGNEWPIIIFHKPEAIAFAYISQGLDRREIEGIPYSPAKEYYNRLSEETEILNAWAQEERRKSYALNWLIARMYTDKGIKNLNWLCTIYCADSEEYWKKVAEIAGVKEEMEKHEQYTSYPSDRGNVFILLALEYGIKNKIYMPFNPREVPLPSTKEIFIRKI